MTCFHIFSAVDDTRVEYMLCVQPASMPQIHFFLNRPEALLNDYLQVHFENSLPRRWNTPAAGKERWNTEVSEMVFEKYKLIAVFGDGVCFIFCF